MFKKKYTFFFFLVNFQSSKVSPMKPAAHNLFSDDDEDDIFSSVKATPHPPVTNKFYVFRKHWI